MLQDVTKLECESDTCKPYPMWRSIRMLIIFLTFLGMFVFTLTRGVIGFAMVCMVNRTADILLQPKIIEAQYQLFNESTPQGCSLPHDQWYRDYDGEFVWTAKQSSLIFAAISWGELVADIPAGYLVQRYGPKRCLLVGGLLGALATFLTPVAARYSSVAVVVTRFFVGVSFAALWPSKSALISAWTRKEESSTAISLVTSGNQLSTVLAMPISALLCRNKGFLGGWPAIFYLTGIATILWSIVWLLLVKDTPNTHPWISEDERHYLMAHKKQHPDKSKVPSMKLLRQPAVLSIILCQGAATWGIFSLLFYLPQYLRDVMLMNLEKNGLFSALPFLSQLILRIFFGISADYLAKRKINRTAVIKTFNSIGFFSLGSMIFGSTFLTCDNGALSVGLMSIGTGLWAAVAAGYVTSTLIAFPRYSAVIASWSKFFGTLIGVILPYVKVAIVDTGTQKEWQIFFGSSLIILFLSGFCFLIWGTGQEVSVDG